MDRVALTSIPTVKGHLLRSGQGRACLAGRRQYPHAGRARPMPTKGQTSAIHQRDPNGIEDASEASGLKGHRVIKGTGGRAAVRAALAADHIMLVDARLPPAPGVRCRGARWLRPLQLPGTGGAHPRFTTSGKGAPATMRPSSDTTEEGLKGRKRAVDWRPCRTRVVPGGQATKAGGRRRQEGFRCRRRRQGGIKGAIRAEIARAQASRDNGVEYRRGPVEAQREGARLGGHHVARADAPPPEFGGCGMAAQGSEFWQMRIARELDGVGSTYRLTKFDTAAIGSVAGDPAAGARLMEAFSMPTRIIGSVRRDPLPLPPFHH